MISRQSTHRGTRTIGNALAGYLFAATLGLGFLAPLPALGQTMDELVKAALKEGELLIQGGPGRAFEESFAGGFRKAYPGMKVNYRGSAASAAIPVITREREAGVYSVDVLIGGAPSTFRPFKDRGFYVPLQPLLIQPGLTEDRAWREGFAAGWLDKEKKFSYGFDYTMEQTAFINRAVIPPREIKSMKDLLGSKYAGKIVWADPRSTGEGIFVSQSFINNFGEELLVKLFVEQKIVYSTNRRQNAEWVALGRYPIALGVSPDDIALLQKEGIGRDVEALNLDGDRPLGGSGFGVLQVFDKAPHPNAARLFANWVLGKEAQALYQELLRRNSRRVDVPPVIPDRAPAAGARTINAQAEAQMEVRERVQTLAREKISAAPR
jgi:iron(III) transport system substrate-binding protein